jgi:hypothetical protein
MVSAGHRDFLPAAGGRSDFLTRIAPLKVLPITGQGRLQRFHCVHGGVEPWISRHSGDVRTSIIKKNIAYAVGPRAAWMHETSG